jgi:hypothetical protein
MFVFSKQPDSEFYPLRHFNDSDNTLKYHTRSRLWIGRRCAFPLCPAVGAQFTFAALIFRLQLTGRRTVRRQHCHGQRCARH